MALPESFNESLHLLGLTLDTDVVLKFPEGLVQLHALEVHFIYHTAGTQGGADGERQIKHKCGTQQVFVFIPNSLISSRA